MDDGSRRQLLGKCAALAALPVLGGLPALDGCARRIDLARKVDATLAADGTIRVTRAQAPELGQAGGAVVLLAPGADPILVSNTGAGLIALDAICPHESCTLTWVQEDLQAECPCHGSRFGPDGTLRNPPAQRSVPAFAVAIDAATQDVIVDTGQILTPTAP